jgi:hypothetical protein
MSARLRRAALTRGAAPSSLRDSRQLARIRGLPLRYERTESTTGSRKLLHRSNRRSTRAGYRVLVLLAAPKLHDDRFGTNLVGDHSGVAARVAIASHKVVGRKHDGANAVQIDCRRYGLPPNGGAWKTPWYAGMLPSRAPFQMNELLSGSQYLRSRAPGIRRGCAPALERAQRYCTIPCETRWAMGTWDSMPAVNSSTS